MKGNAGNVRAVTVIGLVETFVKVTGKVTSLPPMGCGAKSTEVGAMVNDAVAVSPWPLKSNVDVPPE